MSPLAAARQFESLLIGQMLRSVREESEEQDSSFGSAMDMAGQQFASMIAEAGGFGVAELVARGLNQPAAGATAQSPQPER